MFCVEKETEYLEAINDLEAIFKANDTVDDTGEQMDMESAIGGVYAQVVRGHSRRGMHSPFPKQHGRIGGIPKYK